jgi:hypothetical protein
VCDFLWSHRVKECLRLTKKLLHTSRIPVFWDVALQYYVNGFRRLESSCRLYLHVFRPKKNEFFVTVVLDAQIVMSQTSASKTMLLATLNPKAVFLPRLLWITFLSIM